MNQRLVSEFERLIEQVRRGDQAAASRLVEDYEPEVRRFVRFRLSSPSLRRTFDSLDICQSVLCRFFVEISAGRIRLDDPRQLRSLLLTMARNKLYDRVRQEHAERRDARLLSAGGDDGLAAVADTQRSPSEILQEQEVLAAVNELLSDDERYLINERLAGRSWDDLAAELGASPEALRKRMTRAVDEAAHRLGLRST